MCSKKLILLNHYLCGFNNSNHRVALLELQIVSTAPCDRTLNEIVTHPDDHVATTSPNWTASIVPRNLFLAEIGIR
jgi:hypothetical protein